MSGNARTCVILSTSLSIVLLITCGKQEPAATQSAQTAAAPGKWQSSMPSAFAALTLRDGGGCYLDAVNGADAGNGSPRVGSGTPVALSGWAVVDVKQGRTGSALGILLNGNTSYYTQAGSYARPGLGAALKGSSALDAGGLKLDPAPLNVPAGNYRVIFLMQADRDLLRCDTGRSLQIE